MNGYVLKMIEKNTKPPLWKRLYTPGGITFTQFSFILDEMFALPHTNAFGFEFNGCKYQLAEENAYYFSKRRWRFSRRNPDNTYIDDFLFKEPWFSYYKITEAGGKEERAFRVEIEEHFTDAILPAPQVIKAVMIKDDTSWNGEGINDRLKEQYLITYKEETSYPTHAQICEAATKEHCNLVGSTHPVSAPMELSGMSIDAMMKLIAKNLDVDLPKDDEEEQDFSGQETEDPELLWLIKCDYAVYNFYGACPADVFYSMCRMNPAFRLTDKKIDELFSQIPEDERFCVRHGSRIVDEDLLKTQTFRNILSWHRAVNREYSIPTQEEIDTLWKYGYPASDPAYKDAAACLRKNLHYSKEEVEDYLCRVFDMFSGGASVNDVMQKLFIQELKLSDKKVLSKLDEYLKKVFENSRMSILKGNRPKDIATEENADFLPEGRSESKKQGSLSSGSSSRRTLMESLDSGASTVVRSAPRVYPNDPCPCGSGKKYKKCCGRNVR